MCGYLVCALRVAGPEVRGLAARAQGNAAKVAQSPVRGQSCILNSKVLYMCGICCLNRTRKDMPPREARAPH